MLVLRLWPIALVSLSALAHGQALECTLEGKPIEALPNEHVGRLQCVYPGTQRTERIVIRTPQQEGFRVSYSPQGQLRALQCGARTWAPEEVTLCGWVRPMTVTLVDDEGRTRAELTHEDGRRIAYKAFDASGALQATEKRLPTGHIEVVRYAPTGPSDPVRMAERFELDAISQRRIVHERFHDTGRLSERTTWDDAGMPIQSIWDPQGILVERRHAARFEGKLASEVQLFWPTGMMQSRGMVDAQGRALGLRQEFDERGRLVRELLATDGVLQEVWRAPGP